MAVAGRLSAAMTLTLLAASLLQAQQPVRPRPPSPTPVPIVRPDPGSPAGRAVFGAASDTSIHVGIIKPPTPTPIMTIGAPLVQHYIRNTVTLPRRVTRVISESLVPSYVRAGWTVALKSGGVAVVTMTALPSPGGAANVMVPDSLFPRRDRDIEPPLPRPGPDPVMMRRTLTVRAGTSDSVPEWTAPWPASAPEDTGGVVIGVVDTGMWLEHEAFRDAAGQSTFSWYWDEGSTRGGEDTPEDMGYGRECQPRLHGLPSCSGLRRDNNGHGTHVTSIVAGEGPNPRYWGVAPGMVLIGVALPELASPGDILTGIAYVFNRARRLGLPAVVNVSFGSAQGSHGGRMPGNILLDSLVGPGRIVVSSAGNEGDNSDAIHPPGVTIPMSHTESPMTSGQATVGFTIGTYDPALPPGVVVLTPAPDEILMETWLHATAGYAAPQVSLAGSEGTRLTMSPSDTVVADSSRGYTVLLIRDHGDMFGGDSTRWRITVALIGRPEGQGSLNPAAGSWTLSLASTDPMTRATPVEAWLTDPYERQGTINTANIVNGLNRHLIGSPASATRAIAVAAWANAPIVRGGASAPYRCQTCSPLGDISFFSSPGPRPDDDLKPDITAPGEWVAGARVPDSEVFPGDSSSLTRVADDPNYGFLRGTSQASPIVTGAIALALRIQPDMTPEDARHFLAISALNDGFTAKDYATGDTPRSNGANASWGAGKMDILGLISALKGANSNVPLGIMPETNPVRIDGPLRFRATGTNAFASGTMFEVYSMTGERLVRHEASTMVTGGYLVWDQKMDSGQTVPDGVYLVRLSEHRHHVLFKLVIARR